MKLGPYVLSPGSVVGRNDEIVGHLEAVAAEIGNDDNIDVFGGDHGLPLSNDSSRLPGAHVVTPMAEFVRGTRSGYGNHDVQELPSSALGGPIRRSRGGGRRIDFSPY